MFKCSVDERFSWFVMLKCCYVVMLTCYVEMVCYSSFIAFNQRTKKLGIKDKRKKSSITKEKNTWAIRCGLLLGRETQSIKM